MPLAVTRTSSQYCPALPVVFCLSGSHAYSLSLVLVMMKSKEFKTKTCSHANSLILSLAHCLSLPLRCITDVCRFLRHRTYHRNMAPPTLTRRQSQLQLCPLSPNQLRCDWQVSFAPHSQHHCEHLHSLHCPPSQSMRERDNQRPPLCHDTLSALPQPIYGWLTTVHQ